MHADLASIFLRYSSAKLRQMGENIDTCLDHLSDEQIWARGGGNENAIGNLVLHLCGNARQWIIAGVGGETDIRQRDMEFSAMGGVSKGALQRLLGETLAASLPVIEQGNAARLLELVHPQNQTVTVLEAIYQVVGHFQQHTGQIIFATKMLTGHDLQIYKPKP